MWELDYKESWEPKNSWFWTVVLEKTLESPLDSRDPTSPSYRKSVLNIHWKDWCWSWNFNTLATWCEELTLGKDPDAEKDWREEEKGTTEDEMVGWHHWLDGPKFEQAPRDGYGQGSLVCCSLWGLKMSDMTERLNWIKPFSNNTISQIHSQFKLIVLTVCTVMFWFSIVRLTVFLFRPSHSACEISILWLGINPLSPPVEGSSESYPLDHQGNPKPNLLLK